eukprot:1057461-Pelagomonas_calceolata.AAC.3
MSRSYEAYGVEVPAVRVSACTAVQSCREVETCRDHASYEGVRDFMRIHEKRKSKRAYVCVCVYVCARVRARVQAGEYA